MKLQRVVVLLPVIVGFAIAAPNSKAQERGVPEASAPDVLTVELPPNQEVSSAPQFYIRPTRQQKLHSFEFDAIGPYAFSSAIAGAGFQQHGNAPPEWGQGLDAFGARVGSNIGIELISVTTHYGLAEIVHEDILYYPCRCGGVLQRFRHALVSTVTARRGEDGHTVLSISGVIAPYAGSMAALAWYPDRYGVKDAFRMGNYNLVGQAAWNLGFEFIYGGPHAILGRKRFASTAGASTQSASNH